MPAVYCVAWVRVWAFWASICSRPTTVIDCGVSISGVLVLVAVAERVATKPFTGPVGLSTARAAAPTPAPPPATVPPPLPCVSTLISLSCTLASAGGFAVPRRGGVACWAAAVAVRTRSEAPDSARTRNGRRRFGAGASGDMSGSRTADSAPRIARDRTAWLFRMMLSS